MRLTFCGAAGMVTGSCYLLEAGGLKLLVDCGLFQGKEEERNREDFGFHPGALDGAILTHAHIDHSGRLPLLHKQGFAGPIYAHPATADLAAIMLLDSAHIQEADAERDNRKAQRARRPLVEPLYTRVDAEATAKLFRTVPYGQLYSLNDAVQIRFQDAGHILGSCIVEVFETDAAGRKTKLVLSGDLGQPGRPILRDPTPITEADFLVMESTYGNRKHEPIQSTRDALAEVIQSTVAKGGKVIIPAFAVGRTQEVLYQINLLVEEGRLPRSLKIVLDSPLAIAATQVTAKHHEVFDEAAASLMDRGDDPFAFPGLMLSHTGEDSKALNEMTEPMVLIAAGGMCDNGRVVHHLKHNLWKPNTTVLFVGYQAEGTLGRRILDGASTVKIHGEEIAVKARIESLPGLSAHADRDQLLAWTAGFERAPRQTILVHGEAEAREALADALSAKGHRVSLPMVGQSMELTASGAATVRTARPAAVRPAPRDPARAVEARRASQSLADQRMSTLIKELKELRRAWKAGGPHLAPGQAEEVARKAAELLHEVHRIRRLVSGGDR